MSNNLTMSDNAAKRISKLLSEEEEGSYLRISVIGGGCSGFQYHFDFDKTSCSEQDIIIEKDNAKIVVDDMSITYIDGSIVDYVETLGGSAFEIKNPNAQASCGCGNSFSV